MVVRKIHNVVRFTARFLVFLLTGAALVVAIFVAATQVGVFRSWGLEKGLEAINKGLAGRLEVDRISGNFLIGVSLHGVKLHAAGTLLLDAPYVELSYQLSPIFREKIIAASVSIHRPRIQLIRNARDSSWNFEHITQPTKLNDTTTAPFPYTINLNALEIRDAYLQLSDRTLPESFDTLTRSIDYGHLMIEHFNMSAQADIAPTRQTLLLQNMSFVMPRHDFRLIELSGNFALDTTGASIRNLRLETNRTYLELSARLDSVNFFAENIDPSQWDDSPIYLKLSTPRFSMLELKRFIPAVSMLGGTPSLDLEAEGTYGNFAIRNLDLGLTTSRLKLTGRMQNLDNPDSLFIDARLNDSRVAYSDIPIYLPGVPIPDLGYLGTVNLRSAGFSGHTQAFYTAIDARTDIGAVRGAAWLDLRGEVMEYFTDIAVADANLAPITDNPDLASSLTGRIVAAGHGTSIEDIDSRVYARLVNSRLGEQKARLVVARGSIRDGGFVTLDTAAASFVAPAGDASQAVLAEAPGSIEEFKRRTPDIMLSGAVAISAEDRALLAGPAAIGAGGWIDLRGSEPKYRLDAYAARFALSDVIADASTTRFSINANVSGSGIEPDKIEGTAHIDVTSAELPDGRTFTPFSADVLLDNLAGGERLLKLESSLADLTLQGVWTPTAVIDGVVRAVETAIDYASRKANYRGETFPIGGEFGEPMNATYDLTIRDLKPVEIFLDGASIEARGHISGSIRSTRQLVSLSATGTIDLFNYDSRDATIRLDDAQIQLDMQNITPGYIDDIASIDISIKSDSAARFNDLIFASPEIRASLSDGAFSVHGATTINDNITIAIDGVVDTRHSDGYGVAIDTLIFVINDQLRWRNEGPILATIGADRITIDTLALRRADAELITVRGALIEGERFENVEIAVTDGTIRTLARIARGTALYENLRGIDGDIDRARITIDGTLQDPTIVADIVIDSTSYEGSLLGNILLDLHYANQDLTGSVKITAPKSPPGDTTALLARVDIASLPIDLALAAREERFLSSRPVSITARTDSLPLAFVAPFVPGVTIYGGVMNLAFKLDGIFPNVSYSGNGKLIGGRVLVEGNNIVYNVDMTMAFNEDRLTIALMTLKNDPKDLRNSLATLSGHINFDGFTPKDFVFVAEAERLLVLSDATQMVSEEFYGDLVIATPLLTFSGSSFAAPKLEGRIVVLSGNLTMDEASGSATKINRVNYIDYGKWLALNSDTTQFGPPVPDAQADSSTKSPLRAGSLEEQARRLADIVDSTDVAYQAGSAPGFFDKLYIQDLGIDIRGRVYLNIDFSPFQQLRAELVTRDRGLVLNKPPFGEMSLSGTVGVEQGSRFIFFKTFDASGSIQFTGPVGNPKIGISAEFVGRRVQSGNVLQEYTVTVTLNGTVDQPELDLYYTVDGNPGATDRDTRHRNAISLLLFGRLSEELAGGTLQTRVGEFAGSLGESSASSLASTFLTSLLTEGNEFIRSVDIDLSGVGLAGAQSRVGDGTDFGQARLNLVSQFGKIVVRVGGQISDPTGNGTITIDIPLDVITNIRRLRNLVLQLEREAQTIQSSGGSIGQETEVYRIRLQYRVLF